MSAKNQKYVSGENTDLTSYALGELSEAEALNLAQQLEQSPELRAELDETRAMAEALGQALGAEPELELSSAQRAAIVNEQRNRVGRRAPARRNLSFKRAALFVAYAASLVLAVFAGMQFLQQGEEGSAERFAYDLGGSRKNVPASRNSALTTEEAAALGDLGYLSESDSDSVASMEALGYSSGATPPASTPAAINAPARQAASERSVGRRSRSRSKRPDVPAETESYRYTEENSFRSVINEPLSTFSVDVDTASYANVRRFLTNGEAPPVDAVRIEELLNYFNYDYPAPTGGDPFSVNVEVTSAPWSESNRLVRIGLRGKDIAFEARRPTNLVFLLDVSGSMNSPDKLPLVKKSLRLLVDQLEETDHVAIAVYAGAAGLILPPTSGNARGAILEAMERLEAGGSTNGGEGIRLAYALARQNLDPEGVNRVILCTDGDFNVGTSSEGELVRMVKEQARDGIELSVLGFGTGNLKDGTMEQMADHGNGNYSYIDTLREARKVLVEEIGGTLVTIAKDVKIQVEFNPLEVSSYRLIGYENRLLANEDFNDDRVDAGEIGSGHTVTALYEVVPVGAEGEDRSVDPLKYGQPVEPSEDAGRGELMTVKLRYKEPKGSESRLIEQAVRDAGLSIVEASEDTRFAASVAQFGMLLRGSEHAGSTGLESVLRRAAGALGADRGGYRTEFVGLITRAIALAPPMPLEPERLDEEVLRQLESIGYLGDSEE